MSLKVLQSEPPKRAAALFLELQMMYGSKLPKLWEGVEMKDVIDYWDRHLAEWEDHEIKKAVNDLRNYHEYPPTLPEFIKLCRELNRVVI